MAVYKISVFCTKLTPKVPQMPATNSVFCVQFDDFVRVTPTLQTLQAYLKFNLVSNIPPA